MRFLIDENIDVRVDASLKSAGHDVARVPSGWKNGAVAKLCRIDKRILITNDIHFANVLAFPPAEFPGIIRIRIHPPDADSVISALDKLLKRLTASEIKGKLIILEKDDFRIR